MQTRLFGWALLLVGCGSPQPQPFDHAANNAEALARPLRAPATPICRKKAETSLGSATLTSTAIALRTTPKGFCKKADITGVVTANAPMITACYEDALKRNPRLAGKVSMRWWVLLDGSVARVSVLGFSLEDEPTIRCMCDVIAEWKFPEPNGGMCEIRYPFRFTTGH